MNKSANYQEDYESSLSFEYEESEYSSAPESELDHASEFEALHELANMAKMRNQPMATFETETGTSVASKRRGGIMILF